MAKKKFSIETELTAKIDDLTTKLNRANKQVNDFKNKSKGGVDNLIGSLGKIAGVIGVAFTVKEVVELGLKMDETAVKVKGVEQAFNTIDSPNLLNNLRKATNNTINDLELMQLALKAKNFKIPLEEMSKYLQFATQRASETGESVDYLVNSIITGIGRESPQILDNLGISTSNLKIEMQKTGNMASAVGNIIAREMSDVGGNINNNIVTTKTLTTSWQNLMNNISKSTGEKGLFGGILEDINSAINNVNNSIDYLNKPRDERDWKVNIASDFYDVVTNSIQTLTDVMTVGYTAYVRNNKEIAQEKSLFEKLNDSLDLNIKGREELIKLNKLDSTTTAEITKELLRLNLIKSQGLLLSDERELFTASKKMDGYKNILNKNIDLPDSKLNDFLALLKELENLFIQEIPASTNTFNNSIKKVGDSLDTLTLKQSGFYKNVLKENQNKIDLEVGSGSLDYTLKNIQNITNELNKSYANGSANITQLDNALNIINSGIKFANESQYQYLNKFKREIEEILDIFGKSREKLPVYDKLESKGIESVNLKSNDNINTTLKDPNRLKSLIELEKELKNLELERSKSPTPEYYANLTNLIKIKEEEIANFKGEMIGTAYTMVDVFSSSASSFNSMGQAMRSFGNDGAGGIMDMIAAMLQLMVTFEQLASIIQVTSAIKVATNTAEVASNQALIASNSGVAITEATKSGSKMPFPFNIVAIAAGVAAVIAALANISKFETGGIVGGTSFSGDNVLARVNSGEMILNKTQQSKLFKMINDGRVGAGGGNVTFEIKGDRLVGVLNNLNRKTKAYV